MPPRSVRLPFALVALAGLLVAPAASAYRTVLSVGANAGIAQAPCCGNDASDFVINTNPLVFPAISANVPVSIDPPGSTITVDAQATAVGTSIGAKASVDLLAWDAAFTGESIEASAIARFEDTVTASSSMDLYLRPIFHLDGEIRHAAGLTSSVSFILRTILPGDTSSTDVTLFSVLGGAPGTTQLVDTFVTGPDLFMGGGGSVGLTLILNTQVTGAVNDIPAGDGTGSVNFFDTLSVVGFEAYSDPGYSVPVTPVLESEGFTYAVVPEPGTAALLGLGLLGVAGCGGRRRQRG